MRRLSVTGQAPGQPGHRGLAGGAIVVLAALLPGLSLTASPAAGAVLPLRAPSLAASPAAGPAAPDRSRPAGRPVPGPAVPAPGDRAVPQREIAPVGLDPGSPVPVASSADAVTCPAAGDCLAVGYYAVHSGATVDVTLAERWNGHAWSAVPSANPRGAVDSYLDGISCLSPSDCLAVGYYVRASNVGRALTLAERWNGRAWSVVPSPSPRGAQSSYLNGISCLSAADCLAVGTYDTSNSVRTLAERWTGRTWSVVPSPSPAGAPQSVLNAVSCTRASCLAVGYQGSSTGNDLTLAERWNGRAWSVVPSASPAGAMGSFLSGVSCVRAARCLAAGNYTNSSGVIVTLAEAWNGSSWSVTATPPLRGDPYAILSAVSCASGADCWAVGHQLNAPGSYLTLAEHWNGSAWSVVPSRDPAMGSYLWAVSCVPASCLATGDFMNGARNFATLAEAWNGSSWSVVNQDAGLAGTSCAGARDCLAVGSRLAGGQREVTLAQHWNGTRWSAVPSPDPRGARASYLRGVSCPATGRCLAVGDYVNGAFARVSLAESWNGAKWRIVPSPNPAGSVTTSLDGITCTSATDCMAVGTSSGLALAEHWNGTAWSILTVPVEPLNVFSELESVACTSASSCLAVGYYLNQDCDCDLTLAYAWHGSAWSIVPSPAPGLESALAGVACGTRCLAVGNYQPKPGRYLALALGWTGTRWARVPAASPPGARYAGLSAIACASRCQAVGNYQNASRNYVTLAERWNGTAWAVVPSQNPPAGPHSVSYLQAVSCACGACQATGATGGPAGLATLGARWTGSAWHIVPTG